jgi:hypothetical protein
MNKTLLALYGLKWNPFAPAVPASASSSHFGVGRIEGATY